MAEKKADKKPTRTATAKARAVEKAQAAKARASSVPGAKTGSGFVQFIRTQGVVGLAVGLAIGTAAGATVKALVEGFITPIVQFIVGSQDALASATWTFKAFGREADFAWGAFVSSAITLIATAFVIYLIVHFAKLDRIDKKKE
ncbi:MscL family protein [Candidatus Saccharibacteria bacterium]|nr:MscL family protein [Candidatus Saccharibacteria bacterium]